MVRSRVFWGLALWFTAASVTTSALVFQYVPLLTTWGVEMTTILTSVALIGPMQVAGPRAEEQRKTMPQDSREESDARYDPPGHT